MEFEHRSHSICRTVREVEDFVVQDTQTTPQMEYHVHHVEIAKLFGVKLFERRPMGVRLNNRESEQFETICKTHEKPIQ